MNMRSETVRQGSETTEKVDDPRVKLLLDTLDEFVSITRKRAALIEWRATAARSNAQDVLHMASTFADLNIAASLDFAHRLARATCLRDLVELQTAFIQSQVRSFAEQAADLSKVMNLAIYNSAGSKRTVDSTSNSSVK